MQSLSIFISVDLAFGVKNLWQRLFKIKLRLQFFKKIDPERGAFVNFGKILRKPFWQFTF